MESSEDDAGNATSASRRVSAREKDVRQAEDVDATSCYHQEPYEARTLCGTPAMSEDNFDGDSVPSPSAQDVNTSTEAILDMIDEIVDGPGAPKRIPLSLRIYDTESAKASVAVSNRSDPEQDSSKLDNIDIPLPPQVSPVGIAENNNQHNATQAKVQVELSSGIISPKAVITESAASSVSCVIELENDKPLPEPNCPVSSMEPEPSTSCSLSKIPSSNIIQDVQNSLDISDSEQVERTLKCVSSSDNRDSVVVESAESTSSGCSLSEVKTISAEPTTRSPLKRRLVRPTPSDRRPDSTVSSTADSQHVDLETSKPIISENIVKDVSSSSDAVPPLKCSTKPEEIRNIREISICKAETSVSPPKKIKLIRQKVLPTVCKNDIIVDKQIPSTSSQCESTISGSLATCLVENLSKTPTCISSQKSVINTKTLNPEPVVEVRSIVPLVKNECTQSMSVETVEPISSEVSIKKNDGIIHTETECAVPSLSVLTLPVLPATEKDLTNFKQASDIENSIKITEDAQEKSNKNCSKIKNETKESATNSDIENSKTHIEPLNISKGLIVTESENNMNLKVISINDPSSGRSESDQIGEAENKVSPIKLSLSQLSGLSDLSQERLDEEQVDQVSKPEPDHSNIKLKLTPVTEANSNSSHYCPEVEKKVPPIKLNLSQLDKSQERVNEEQVDQSSNVLEVTDISKPSNTELKLKAINSASSSVSDCYQEAEKRVPPIKLNLLQLSDTSQKLEDHSSNLNVPEISESSNIESKVESVNDPNISTSLECYQEVEKKVPPIKLNLSQLIDTSIESVNLTSELPSSTNKTNLTEDEQESIKQIPKLTIKLSNKTSEEIKSPKPKLTIKPIKPPIENESSDKVDNNQQIPNVTKINIKAIPKPVEKNDTLTKQVKTEETKNESEHIPTVMKLNIKPILKPPEKINDIHRKSSSSEISESEYSENDDSTSTSDQASASDNATSEVIPKVTIKLGKPGTQSEGKFYTEQNVPKRTIKSFPHPDKQEQESISKLKVVISQPEDKHVEKIPKLTIKTVAKSESQPLSPKLTIKPIKLPDSFGKEPEIPKLKITTETLSSNADSKENVHVPKITIKPITKPDIDMTSKAAKRSVSADSLEQIPVVTKLNIKPVLRPTESGESSEILEDKVPVVSKLNIKPVIKPKDNEVDSSIEDVPKITKLNIKPLKNPEANTSEKKDCDDMNADIDKNSLPIITKLNIKPIVKPLDKEINKDSESQSPETGNSSDENPDNIPVVTKLNIKPILKPIELEEVSKTVMCNEPSIPIVTKLNIKPLVKPDESTSPSSPKKDSLKSPVSHNPTMSIITKLNIKPLGKYDETELSKLKEDVEKPTKNPPLVMKINMKTVTDSIINEICSTSEYSCNSIKDNIDMKSKIDTKSGNHSEVAIQRISSDRAEMMTAVDGMKLRSTRHSVQEQVISEHVSIQNCISNMDQSRSTESSSISKKQDNVTTTPIGSPKDSQPRVSVDIEQNSATSLLNKTSQKDGITAGELQGSEILRKSSRATLQYCTLLKKLLENPKEEITRKSNELKDSMKVDGMLTEKIKSSSTLLTDNIKCELNLTPEPDKRTTSEKTINLEKQNVVAKAKSPSPDKINETTILSDSSMAVSLQNFSKTANENITKPLEICVTEKITNQSSGQDSPRIILKINKTDHGPSAKIITEDVKKLEVIQSDATQQLVNDKPSPKKQLENSKKKGNTDLGFQNILAISTRLRSSKKLETAEILPTVRQSAGKRPSSTEPSPSQNRENEMSVLDAKRLKLGEILSNNAMISQNVSISPVSGKVTQPSPTKPTLEIRRGGKLVNHSILNNDNCSKNGNSKLHNILSNLHAKQMQALPFNEINCSEKTQSTSSEMDSNASTGSSEVVEHTPIEIRPLEVQEMLINENSDFNDSNVVSEELSQDPLEPEEKSADVPANGTKSPRPVETTPQPKKRGRPRKLPVTETPKIVTLPVPALEERPQRSLRLTRERPVIVPKPRGGRGRGRGSRRGNTFQTHTPLQQMERVPTPPTRSPTPPMASPTPIDPTSSRIKLPRMTEALDKMPSSGSTPLSAGSSDLSLFSERAELKVVLEPAELDDSFMKSPESVGRPRGGRGSRGGRGRTPRGRGRGRGGGRGAMYMKETMGIYGRVCGPATTTVQLFEEETCMMDDNATPAKPSHLMDEDSQSSVKSLTNESSKMKKSKFADLFDSNKVWTAADVKEYTWPATPRSDMESQVMMIQEQVAMFLGVKSFKRRYPELKRRTIVGEERNYVLAKGLVTEALCDLGITAVDASEVLDIMLSDYPHKYEEYRSHQRERQMTEVIEEPSAETKSEEKVMKVEMKQEKTVDNKPEQPKVDPEKTRQDMAAAAIASASEWNARANASRRPACVDLQSMTVHVRRAPAPAPPPPRVRPPAGFYPHALLPGQYQHWYRHYAPEHLRYFPLNTACAAPPPAPAQWECSSSSEGEGPAEGEGSRAGDEDDSDAPAHPAHHNKRKKLTKTKRSSQTELMKEKEDSRSSVAEGEVVDTCRACKLRLEANRKYTHERFLVCANCNAKLHPSCVELSADTIRKCREYAWQCAECKSCNGCQRPADDDKMLFCDLCDRGFHIYCVGLDAVPQGRWHCVECAICKSCGARDPSGVAGSGSGGPGGQGGHGTPGTPGGSEAPPEWHHQTKRGPGGHKCYSHSLCTPCARAYRIGRYCPLCERSFIGPKGTMQLVICKLCDRQLHQECVRQTVSSLNVLDYTCADCRRGGITSRAAAVRLAPRTIATLFMAKRRFNKYAHRQYLASRMAAHAANDDATDASADALHMDFGD
ncbi:hypothetical protein K1T71_008369 [Dendrolimus kikuchii]|uniref:Uncharacterized protein n=1 Tax=Dendrolimus kikuchii TaxID=765133 RepID=A0ACC1CXJ6_9NEOP|nr:hypothetical protein K1T71_008369 [Dendrolimus kikuchii]